MENRKRATRSEFVVGQSSRNIRKEITTVLTESCMAKLHENIHTEVVENVIEIWEEAIFTSYSDFNEGFKSAMFNIVEILWRKSFLPAKV